MSDRIIKLIEFAQMHGMDTDLRIHRDGKSGTLIMVAHPDIRCGMYPILGNDCPSEWIDILWENIGHSCTWTIPADILEHLLSLKSMGFSITVPRKNRG